MDERVIASVKTLRTRLSVLESGRRVIVVNAVDLAHALDRLGQLEDENEILKSALSGGAS